MKRKMSFALAVFFMSMLQFQEAQALSQNQVNAPEIQLGKFFETWVKKEKGRPVEVGFSADAQALTSLPDQHMELILNFPKSRHQVFQHLALMWEPGGHEPPGIYDVPHFDIHFYFISDQERKKISCQGSDAANCLMQPKASEIPPNYAPTEAGVPKMGWHWVDLLAPELNGGSFTSTLIYGYYKGRLAFLEPMITKAFLLTKPNVTFPIRQPQVYPRSGYYPTRYQVKYDFVEDQYHVILRDLVYRK